MKLKGTVRTMDLGVREQLKNKIEKMSTAIADSFGGKAEIDYSMGYPSIVNSKEESCLLKRVLISKFG